MEAFGYLLDNRTCMAVAVSGGSDSMALLTLAAEFGRTAGISVSAITVDHGLRPEARDEARFVSRACAAMGVAHRTLTWRREDDAPVGQEAARRARHGLLATWARKANIGAIALGHTRDDRIETFLMRARQGSGWHGLAGLMPEGPSPVWPEGRGMRLLRPLLAFGREELRGELRARGVAWIEDPSNEAARYERVRMRRLLQRVDAATITKSLRVMDRLMTMRAGVASQASALLAKATIDATGAAIPLLSRRAAGEEAWMRLVEAMVMAAGGAERPPRRDALNRLLARIADGDAQLTRGVTLAGAKIGLRRGALVVSQASPRRGAAPAEADWARAEALLRAPDLRSLSV